MNVKGNAKSFNIQAVLRNGNIKKVLCIVAIVSVSIVGKMSSNNVSNFTISNPVAKGNSESRIGPFEMPISGKNFEIFQPLYDMDDSKKNKPLYAPPDEFIKTFEERIAWADTLINKKTELQKMTTKEHATKMYVEMMKTTLTATIFDAAELSVGPALGKKIQNTKAFDRDIRKGGTDWTYAGDTMIGWQRADNILQLLTDVIQNNIEGDYIETGVWRGGASVLAKAIMSVLDPGSTRVSYVCDSFRGLPAGEKKLHKNDEGWDNTPYLEVPSDVVANNFIKYRMLDSNVVFVKGFFNETMPPLSKNVNTLAVMRLDVSAQQSFLYLSLFIVVQLTNPCIALYFTG